MTLPKFPLTISLAWDKGHCYIETCLLLAGCWVGSVTTSVAIAGPMQEATEKIIDLQNYVSQRLTK